MNELQIFEKAEFGKVRIVMRNGEPWFVARDVAVALGYADPADAIQRHCKKINDSNMGVSPSVPSPKIIPESDVYRLVMRSNLPTAIEFQDWVCEEVIPSLRKTGGYMLTKADDTPETIMARAVLVAQETIERLKNRTVELEEDVQRMKPKELFADSVSASESSILVGQLAALLKQNGVNIGQNRLFERLRNDGFLIKFGERRNCPTQRALEMGLFELKERTVNNPDGSVRITLTTKVTGKGQVYFVNRYIGKNLDILPRLQAGEDVKQEKNLGGSMELKKQLQSLQTLEGFMEEQMRVDLERKAVELFEQKRIEKGLSVDALAAQLYPEVPIANARMNLNRLRKPQVNGKPKRLLFGDFVDLCIALDMVPERVISQTITAIIEHRS